MDLSKMSVQEIKAVGFDQQILLQQTQLNLQLIAQELEKRYIKGTEKEQDGTTDNDTK
jgi:hypothetical protein